MEPIIASQDRSKNWAFNNAKNGVPNLDKLAIITNQTPQNIHDIMNHGGFEVDWLGLHWLPQNSDEYNLKSEAEQKQIDKDYRYILNNYIYDSGIYF